MPMAGSLKKNSVTNLASLGLGCLHSYLDIFYILGKRTSGTKFCYKNLANGPIL
jgi:hypothetical protein